MENVVFGVLWQPVAIIVTASNPAMMIGEAIKCPREVFLEKTMSCTDDRNQSERDDESAERPLDSNDSDPATSDETARMVTEAQQPSKPDAVTPQSDQVAGNRPSSRLPQSRVDFCRNWHFLPPGQSSKSEPYR